MTMKVFNGPDVSLPVFNVGSRSGGGILTLSSHARAREALELGPGVADLGFKIFVVGEDSRGRMTAALAYLERHLDGCPPRSETGTYTFGTSPTSTTRWRSSPCWIRGNRMAMDNNPASSVYGCVMAQLADYNSILFNRVSRTFS
jgi:hypothetical protein